MLVTDERVEEYAAGLLKNEVFCCQSYLVDNLLRLSSAAPPIADRECEDLVSAFSVEEIRNFYPDPTDWTEAQCRQFLDDYGYGPPETDDLESLRDAVREVEPREIFEWWLVSSWLAEELEKIGEPVLCNGYGHWWGRTCTGQGVLQDGTLQKVARDILAR